MNDALKARNMKKETYDNDRKRVGYSQVHEYKKRVMSKEEHEQQ